MSYLKICQGKEEIEKRAGEALSKVLKKESEFPILLLLSGGSSFKILDFVDLDPVENLTVGVLDERFSKDPGINNFAQLMETGFFKRVLEKQASLIDSRVEEKETLPMLKTKFESGVVGWKKENPKGKIIVTLGIGDDGHVAGIMPFPENKALFENLFEDKDSWVVGYDARDKNPYPLRVTVSISFLKNAVDAGIVFASGESKKEALEKVLADEGELYQVPGRVIQEMQDLCLFTDVDLEN